MRMDLIPQILTKMPFRYSSNSRQNFLNTFSLLGAGLFSALSSNLYAEAGKAIGSIRKFQIEYNAEKNPLSLRGFMPGVGSGLDFARKDGSTLVFMTVADNATHYMHKKKARPFFGELHIDLQGKKAKLRRIWPLKLPDTSDLEGVAFRQTSVWFVDEGKSRILQYSFPELKIVSKLNPGKELPGLLGAISENRGFEGIDLTPSGKIVCVIQGPLKPDLKYFKQLRFLRFFIYDPETKLTNSYAYQIPDEFETDAIRLSSIVAVDEQTFVISERGQLKSGEYANRLQLVSIEGVKPLPKKLVLKKPEQQAEVLVKKTLLADLREYGWTAMKSEGMALLPNKRTLAIMSDQDLEAGEKNSVLWLLEFESYL